MDQMAEVKRGEEAERLMNNPLLKEAFDKLRNGIMEAMATSAVADTGAHHNLVLALQTLMLIERNMREIMTTGKMASIQLEKGFTGKLRAAAGF